MKQCKKCLQDKEETEFYSTNYKDKKYLLNECKQCTLARTRKAYLADHEKQKAIRKRNTKKRRSESKQKILEYLQTHPCVDCKEKDPIVLEFDHLFDKSFGISEGFMKSWEVLEQEILKCEVVCANCHKRRTAKRSGAWYKDVKQ